MTSPLRPATARHVSPAGSRQPAAAFTALSLRIHQPKPFQTWQDSISHTTSQTKRKATNDDNNNTHNHNDKNNGCCYQVKMPSPTTTQATQAAIQQPPPAQLHTSQPPTSQAMGMSNLPIWIPINQDSRRRRDQKLTARITKTRRSRTPSRWSQTSLCVAAAATCARAGFASACRARSLVIFVLFDGAVG